MIFPQMLLDLHCELIVDLFAGGGGASLGIEMATGRMVDIAINHDPAAVAMHKANHPQTRHLLSDVFEADPREVTQGRPVGLLWASPDCTHHSKARGGKPLRDRARRTRALAWVVTRWAGTVRPRVIILENVEEFADWGPLVGPPDRLRPCPRRKGRTFRQWVRSLERHGYEVQWRELRACDYGAPTIRKRLFVIARCDGRPIIWPEPTHGPGRRFPYRTAVECIDWPLPMLSIFASPEEAREWARVHGVGVPVRPLAEATLRRIARGVVRFVLENPEPFIVGVAGNGGQLVAAYLQSYYGAENRQDLREPLRTIPTRDRFGLVTVTIAGQPYVITDIAMRMLTPRELYRAQGFPDSYIIDRGADGRRLTKTEQVRMVGNSVCPQVAAALVRANVPEMIARDEVRVPMRRKRAMATA